MKIEFTKDDLDYLAEKIAEMMDKRNCPRVNPDKPIASAYISDRLLHIFEEIGFDQMTIRELSLVRARDWERVRGMGDRMMAELMQLFAEAGCTIGTRRLDYDRQTGKYSIL